ncbi:MAG: ArsR/SmtB family transcription factor [Francisella endosymbiont of Hyalomma asiaticum]
MRILVVVYEHQLCLCHLAHIFKLANSILSKHLDILRRDGFIYKRKQGRFHYFYFNSAYHQQLNWLLDILADDETIQSDQKLVKQLIAQELKHLPEIYAKENIL